jgi:hypothetical protein
MKQRKKLLVRAIIHSVHIDYFRGEECLLKYIYGRLFLKFNFYCKVYGKGREKNLNSEQRKRNRIMLQHEYAALDLTGSVWYWNVSDHLTKVHYMSSAICDEMLYLHFRLLFDTNNHHICGLTPHPSANTHICGNLLLIQNLFVFLAMRICWLFIDATRTI